MKNRFRKGLALVLTLVLSLGCCTTALAAEDDPVIYTVQLEGTCKQTEARRMLDLINDFRTGEDAWYWNSSDTEKVKCNDLGELTYDYTLEKIAMQRAAEIAVSFSHSRPNGSRWTTATAVDDSGIEWGSFAENIYAGYGTAERVFNSLAEADQPYSGQGHRRNMLSDNYTAVGVACIYYEGYYYWVQEFGRQVSDAAETPANDSDTRFDVDVESTKINSITVNLDEDLPTELEVGDSVDLPEVTADLQLSERWPEEWPSTVFVDAEWSVSPEGIIALSDGQITAKQAGTATLTAVALGESTSVEITVTPPSISSAQVTLEQDSYSYTGKPITPAVTVTFKGTVLKENTDYTLTYANNTKVGTATVTVTGTGGYSGSVTKEFTIVPCTHAWDNGKVTTAATCTEDGVKTYTCTNCGETKTEAIPATGHAWDAGKVTTAATCTETGTKTYTCTNCGETRTESIPATGHAWDDGKVTTAATCTETGTKTYTCTNCGETRTEAIPATGHAWDDGKVTTPATCTKDGVKTYTCANCGETKTEAIPATGHAWDAGKVTTPAACTETGTKTYTCTNCGETGTEAIPAIGHSYVTDPAVEPTFTQTGLTQGSHCQICGEIGTAQEVVPVRSIHSVFYDVADNSWYAPYVAAAYETGLTAGVGEHTFAPESEVNRAMFVTMLYSMAGKPQVEGNCAFTDVPQNAYYRDAVIWAAAQGVTAGVSETSFAPNSPITREQMVTMLYAYARSCGVDMTVNTSLKGYADANQISGYAVDAMTWAVGNQLMVGRGANTLAPKAPITRAEIVTILVGYAKKFPAE